LPRYFSPEEDAIILDCVEKARQSGDYSTKGFDDAAKAIKKTREAIRYRYYKILSGALVAEKTGKVKQIEIRKMFTEEEDAIIRECVEEACKTGSSTLKGLEVAARRLNRSYDSVRCRYGRIKKSGNSAPLSIREVLEEMVRKGEIPPADKEKLTKVAQLTGEHYHTVLSTFGAITACGAVASKESCDKNCPWYKAVAVNKYYESGLSLGLIAAAVGMTVPDVKNYVKVYQEGQSAQLNAERENELLRAQVEQKDAEINAFGKDLETSRQEIEQHRIILNSLAQELGIRDWDGKPTVYFANEVFNKLIGLVSHYIAARRLGVRLLKKVAQKSAGPGIAQRQHSRRQEAQLH